MATQEVSLRFPPSNKSSPMDHQSTGQHRLGNKRRRSEQSPEDTFQPRGRRITISGSSRERDPLPKKIRKLFSSSIEVEAGSVSDRDHSLLGESLFEDPFLKPCPELSPGFGANVGLVQQRARCNDMNPNIGLSLSKSVFVPDHPKSDGIIQESNLLPPSFVSDLLDHVDRKTYLALRATCKSWYQALPSIKPLAQSAAHRLPTELLQQIYQHLSPAEFNAARHSCRTWMLASLESRLLTTMLRRGGWWGAVAENNPGLWTVTRLNRSLTRECLLRAFPSPRNAMRDPPWFSLNISSTIDFAELGTTLTGLELRRGTGLRFTVSLCGKFVAVADGCIIYIYQLQPPNPGDDSSDKYPQAVTSIICPRRVIAINLDTSCNRFAIGALMDGRMGLMCDILEGLSPDRRNRDGSSPRADPPYSFETNLLRRAGLVSLVGEGSPGMDYERPLAHASHLRPHGFTSINKNGQLSHALTSPISSSLLSRETLLAQNQARRGIPVDIGPRNIYRNLCSGDDPPRSVAVCPQRRCIAFGCSAGIELHWTDSMTGQDLNRWFPLTAASDFLYFMPPRPVVDSPKKLRLISSIAHPSVPSPIPYHRTLSRSDATSFWLRNAFHPSSSSSSRRSMINCDHYHAIPLSDGNHILFTDPETNYLCLGNDAPLGSATKLTRKVLFVPPFEPSLPTIYACCNELTWGLRVVAAYGEHLCLYSVPEDVFRFCAGRKAQIMAPLEAPTSMFLNIYDRSTVEDENIWLDWWYNDEDTYSSSSARFSAGHSIEWQTIIFPLRLRGIHFGQVPGLVDLSIISDATGPTIWAFSKDGRAFQWRMQQLIAPSKKVVRRDGVIVDQIDDDGDTFMHGTEHNDERTIGFDGTACSHLVPGDDVDGDTDMPDHQCLVPLDMNDDLDFQDRGRKHAELEGGEQGWIRVLSTQRLANTVLEFLEVVAGQVEV